jgi:hypothetical protein
MKPRLPALILVPVLALGCIAAAPARAAATPVASFRCGGIGNAEQTRFKGQAQGHDALVTFATRSGAYVADVDFRLTGPDGKVVLQGTCDGPLMLLDVGRNGSYRMDATFQGQSQTRTLRVGPDTARLSFLWNAG